MTHQIIIKREREKSLLRHHPWIFAGSIKSIHGTPKPGETVDVLSSNNQFIAKAAYNAHSQIAARVWSWNENEEINPDFFERKINISVRLRLEKNNLIRSDAYRLVHGESDGLPGLILDKYGDVCVVQFLTGGVEFWRDELIEIIHSTIKCKALFERSDVDVRQLEGLPERKGLLFGQTFTNPVMIVENNLQILVDIVDGHKTGFYLDQRDNRLLARNISAGRKVLDCFSYTGGFTINSLFGNAVSVTLVDSSRDALDFARKNIQQNALNLGSVSFVEQDVFKYLRTLRDVGEAFDLIILDPPKFAPTIAQAERAARGYKDINLLALKLLKKDGYLLTFSCSGGISEELFQKILVGATVDAGIEGLILQRLHQGLDHPVALNFPEGAYLKGFLIQNVS
jgi:23S rRNA (cytosine1962-C5)-methyltransferase